MIDYSYVECTSACVTALAAFASQFPKHRVAEVTKSIRRGTDYIRAIQRPDGAFYGKWAVCFTYGAWFGVEGLLAGGEVSVAHTSVGVSFELMGDTTFFVGCLLLLHPYFGPT